MDKKIPGNRGWQKMGDLLGSEKQPKAPSYRWQDLALKIIDELNIPNYKRGAVFQVCRDYPEQMLKQALIDTKELCQAGLKWKYFFKILGNNIVWDK